MRFFVFLANPKVYRYCRKFQLIPKRMLEITTKANSVIISVHVNSSGRSWSWWSGCAVC